MDDKHEGAGWKAYRILLSIIIYPIVFALLPIAVIIYLFRREPPKEAVK